MGSIQKTRSAGKRNMDQAVVSIALQLMVLAAMYVGVHLKYGFTFGVHVVALMGWSVLLALSIGNVENLWNKLKAELTMRDHIIDQAKIDSHLRVLAGRCQAASERVTNLQ